MNRLNIFIKNNIFGFILGSFIFGVLGVYAGSEILSKNIEYDNTSSGLSATNAQDAIDELYKNYVCQYDIDTEWTYEYTGSEQDFLAPCDGVYKIELWGAQGGNYTSTYTGGKGAYTSGNILIDKNETLYVYVGSQPSSYTGGYNGGGSGETYTNYGQGYGGGGATDVRLVNGTWSDFDSLKSRIMVAAGGGGTSYYNNDGYLVGINGDGGSLNGIDGYYSILRSPSETGWGGNQNWTNSLYGFGGTQVSGGNPGKGSNSYCATDKTVSHGSFGLGGSYGNCSSSSAGGGGGYYGGGATARTGYSGGGGSSFISGHEGCNAISESSSSSSIVHTGSSIHYSGYKFTSSEMIAGNASMPTHDGTSTMTGNSGNGYAKITLVSLN